MADLYSRAQPAPSNDAHRQQIFGIVTQELAVNQHDLQQLTTFIFLPTIKNGGASVHLQQPVTITMLDNSQSPLIFNVFDALATIHTILARKYGALPWESQLNPAPLSRQPLHKILTSLRNCCLLFQNSKKILPTMVGYTATNTQEDIQFGCVAAGTPEQKQAIAMARANAFGYYNLLQRQQQNQEYIQRQIGYYKDSPKPAFQREPWVCGNCAEASYFPLPRGTREEMERRFSRPIRSDDIPPPIRLECRTIRTRNGELEENCQNCKLMRRLLQDHGLYIENEAM